MLIQTIPILLSAISNFGIIDSIKKQNLNTFDSQGPELIPKEGKMINILTNDVHTYVRELISKEFGSGNKEEKAHSENRKLINSTMRQASSSISDGAIGKQVSKKKGE